MTYPSFKTAMAKFLSPDQIMRAINDVAAAAKEPYSSLLLIGGAAMQLYGSDRFTRDVDFASHDLGVPFPRRPSKPLAFGGYTQTTPRGTSIDIIIRDDDYAALYADAIDHPVAVQDIPIPVVAPSYLAAMKLFSGRPKDIEDLKHLIREFTKPLMKAARKIIHQHGGQYAVEDFDSLTVEVELEKSGRLRRRR